MQLRIAVEQPTDHLLILSAVPLRLPLEEVDAAFGERDRNLYPLLSKG